MRKTGKKMNTPQRKSRRLLFQIGISVIVLFLFVVAFISQIVYKKTKEMYLESKRSSFGTGIYAVRMGHQSYDSSNTYLWYLDYARDNPDFVSRYENPGHTANFEEKFLRLTNQYGNIFEFPKEDAMNLSVRNREFLISAYIDNERNFLSNFDEYLDYDNVSIISLSDDSFQHVLEIAKDSVAVRPLSDVINISDMKDIMDGKSDPVYRITDFENKKNAYYTCFLPITDNETGKNVGIVRFSYDYQRFIKGARKEALSLLAIEGLVLIAAVLMILIYVRRKVIHPLERLQNGVTDYISDKDSPTLIKRLKMEKAQNEFGVLAKDVGHMAAEMERRSGENIKLAEEKAATESELKLAAHIQTGSLPGVFPPFPDRTEFDIYASMNPAKDVGGDYYDFFMIDRNHLCLVIADVSGKGVPAALFMMMSRQLIRYNVLETRLPDEVLFRTNNQLLVDNPDGMFVTAWLGILDVSTGKLLAANAGHEYPAVYKNGKGFELLKEKHGVFLGGFPDSQYETYEIQLEKGDMIFVYTDGVPEARKTNGEFFQASGMLDSLKEIRNPAPEKVIRHVRASLNAFIGDAEQYDDITMLAVRFWGNTE